MTGDRLNLYLRENGYRIAGRVYLFLGFIFLLLPIAFLILFSFQKNVYSSLPLQAGPCSGTTSWSTTASSSTP